MKKDELNCFNCDTDFHVLYESKHDPEFCPFCGEVLEDVDIEELHF